MIREWLKALLYMFFGLGWGVLILIAEDVPAWKIFFAVAIGTVQCVVIVLAVKMIYRE